jgi:D-alanyl-D-alanine dipeptidase
VNHPFSARPIPILTPPDSSERNSIQIDTKDPRSREPLVDVRELGIAGDNYYAREDGSNPPYNVAIKGAIAGLLLREGARAKLAAADATLRSFGLRFFVFDGYRPIATQEGLWYHIWSQIEKAYPEMSATAVEKETLKFVSDPRSFDPKDPNRNPPLHATGGAVDLTLIDASGVPLDLGTPFDDTTPMAATAYFELELAKGKNGKGFDACLSNRRVLYWCMREAGFTNYLNEWWHFDLGNQMHVLSLDLLGEPLPKRTAWYGYTEQPLRS